MSELYIVYTYATIASATVCHAYGPFTDEASAQACADELEQQAEQGGEQLGTMVLPLEPVPA